MMFEYILQAFRSIEENPLTSGYSPSFIDSLYCKSVLEIINKVNVNTNYRPFNLREALKAKLYPKLLYKYVNDFDYIKAVLKNEDEFRYLYKLATFPKHLIRLQRDLSFYSRRSSSITQDADCCESTFATVHGMVCCDDSMDDI